MNIIKKKRGNLMLILSIAFFVFSAFTASDKEEVSIRNEGCYICSYVGCAQSAASQVGRDDCSFIQVPGPDYCVLTGMECWQPDPVPVEN